MARLSLVAGLVCWAAAGNAGTYNIFFHLPDQILPFDTFGDPPATVLAPAGVYRGTDDTTVLELLSGALVASDPDGGPAGEYSALALTAQSPATAYDNGAIAWATLAGSTLEDIRDGFYPGLAVGMTIVDISNGTYFLAAINRTTAGADFFDNLLVGGVVDRALLAPGTGYYAVWETSTAPSSTVLAVQPIPPGALTDQEFRVEFDSDGVANFFVGTTPLLTGHPLAAQPERAGLTVMSWGTPTGNTPYAGVTFGEFHATGQEVPDGGVPGIPATGWMALCVLALTLGGLATRRMSAGGAGIS